MSRHHGATPAANGEFLRDVLAGLRARPKTLPCKYFYDRRGVELYTEICRLDEYYPTRTERRILAQHGAAIAARLGRRCTLVEYGSGSVDKLEPLLSHLDAPAAYVPVDLSRSLLDHTVQMMAERFPALQVRPVCADFVRPFAVPDAAGSERTVVLFPGSTIGNFRPAEALPLLDGMRRLCAPDGRALIGIDLQKDPAVLVSAYDDARGVTAAFNLNLLSRINRELGGDFDLAQFRHRAVFNEAEGRVEMHLVSRTEQTVHLDGHTIDIAAGEGVQTENCYKYTRDGFAELAARAGLAVEAAWTDDRDWFAVVLLKPA
jgi:L-histidine Nalpha-methyltransferase